jgi:hypothetical protein
MAAMSSRLKLLAGRLASMIRPEPLIVSVPKFIMLPELFPEFIMLPELFPEFIMLPELFPEFVLFVMLTLLPKIGPGCADTEAQQTRSPMIPRARMRIRSAF